MRELYIKSASETILSQHLVVPELPDPFEGVKRPFRGQGRKWRGYWQKAKQEIREERDKRQRFDAHRSEIENEQKEEA